MTEIRLDQAARAFDGDSATIALRGVTLDIEPGDFVVITGPSGSGKSTLLNLIGLLDHPSSGAVYIDGVGTTSTSDAALTRLRAGAFAFIFQSFHLLDRRPVIDSVELGLMYQGVPISERRAAVAKALRQVGLIEKTWHDVNTLSGGERQRVAIARAVASGAGVIIADEPTGNLDSQNAQRIVDLLVELNAGGATVVLVTHSEEVAAIAARKVRIRDGRLIDDKRVRPIDPRGPDLPPVRERKSNLRLRDLTRDAIRSIRARGLRTAGLIAAVAVAVALAIATFGITVSAQAQVTDTFNAHTSRDVTAQWSVGTLSNVTDKEQSTMLNRIAGLNGVQHAALIGDLGPHTLQATAAREALSVGAFAVTADVGSAARLSVTRPPALVTSSGRMRC